MKISIVGGNGPMGALFKGFFEKEGHTVQPLGRKDEDFYKERLCDSDVVIVSVPISVTNEVIRKIGPFIDPDSLLMDMTSIKVSPVEEMLKAFPGEVVGTHPLFGPSIDSLSGQIVVITPARGEKGLLWLTDTYKRNNVKVTLATPEEHDRFMALTQCVRTLNTMVLSKLIMDNHLDPKTVLEYSTPIFKAEMWWVGRLFSQDPELYAGIQMNNNMIGSIFNDYLAAGKELVDIITRKNKGRFSEFFKESADYYKEILDEAQIRSNEMINEITRE
jgi:prephenate dehydrogenase